MRRTRWLPLVLGALLLSGALGPTVAAGGRGAAACSETRAMKMIRSSPSGSMANGVFRLIGGSARDGWLFKNSYDFFDYVGPGCGPWFPAVVGAITQRIVSARYIDHRFFLTGTGNGSDGPGPGTMHPYTVMVNPLTQLSTIDYVRDPLPDTSAIVLPLHPGLGPATVHSIGYARLADGFRLTIVASLDHPAMVSVTGEGPNPIVGAGNFLLTMEGAALPPHPARGFPAWIQLRQGLPQYYTSIYDAAAWGPGAAEPLSGLHSRYSYTITISGVSVDWLLTTHVTAAGVVLQFIRP